jgi:hypothetical protein
MKKNLSLVLAVAVILFGLSVPLAAQAAAQAGAQDKPADMKKLLAEIVGDYDFSFQGQSMIIQFTETEGKLYGAPVGQPGEMISPVEGKLLCFDVTVSESGEYYILQFVRNEKGVIDKCVITVQSMTIEGSKIIKSPPIA